MVLGVEDEEISRMTSRFLDGGSFRKKVQEENRFGHQDVFNFECGEFKILVGH